MDKQTCDRCHETKDLKYFKACPDTATGYSFDCRICDMKQRRGDFKGEPVERQQHERWRTARRTVERRPIDYVARFWSRVKKTDECWIWIGTVGRSGSGYYGYKVDGKSKREYPHRYSYELSTGQPLPKRKKVLQVCGNKACVRPDHLLLENDLDDPRYEEYLATRKWRTPGDPVARFWSKVKKTEQCWMWAGAIQKSGTGSFGYYVEGKLTHLLAHRYSYELHFRKLKYQERLFHKCGNKACVRPDHLVAEDDGERYEKYLAKKHRKP